MSAAAIYRTLLKKAIRNHPNRDSVGTSEQIANASISSLEVMASALSIDMQSLKNEAQRMDEQTATLEPETVFSAPPSMDTSAPTSAPAPKADPAKVDAEVAAIMGLLGMGDFDGYKRRLGELIVARDKPPAIRTVTQEVEKIVEKEVIRNVEVEKIVEIPAPPEGNRPEHMPKKTGETVKIAGVPFAVWDAPDAPGVDSVYHWQPALRPALVHVSMGRHAMLSGPAGTGKTSAAEQIAAQTKRPFVRISCHQETSPADWVGGFIPDGKGGLKWSDGVLLRAIRRPGTLVLVDEPSLARPEAQAVLHSVMEPHGAIRVDATGEHVRVMPGVSFMMADNTAGSGDTTGSYAGTGRMNRALLDRCSSTVIVPFLSADREVKVLVSKTGIKPNDAERLVRYANLTRAEMEKGKIVGAVGLRRLLAWSELLVSGLVSNEDAFEATVMATAAPDDKPFLLQLFKIAMAA